MSPRTMSPRTTASFRSDEITDRGEFGRSIAVCALEAMFSDEELPPQRELVGRPFDKPRASIVVLRDGFRPGHPSPWSRRREKRHKYRGDSLPSRRAPQKPRPRPGSNSGAGNSVPSGSSPYIFSQPQCPAKNGLL